MTACLCIENWNGKVFLSLFADKKTIPASVRERHNAGFVRYVEIADADAGYSLELLRRLYLQMIDVNPKSEEQAKAETASAQAAKEKHIKMPKGELVRILDGIIRTSNQEGEREAAMAVYKRIAGKEWRM
jgi:hypothetical protein